MRIMGIDPSLTGCGLALVIDGHLKVAQTVSTPAKDPRGKRLDDISEAVASFIIIYKPDFIAMEGYSFGSSYNREEMGEVGGVIKRVLYAADIEPMIWQNTSWKKVALGNGKLKKEDVKVVAYKRYEVDISDSNQVEAFCVAMAEHMAQANPVLRPIPKKKRGVKK